MPDFNSEQFEPWIKRVPLTELHQDHKQSFRSLVGLHQINNFPADKPWPVYRGMGDSLLAHEGIVARGHRQILEEVENELRSRGRGVPLHHLGTLPKAVADPQFPIPPYMNKYRERRQQRDAERRA